MKLRLPFDGCIAHVNRIKTTPILFFLFLILASTGCSEMTTREKWLLGAMVASNAADAYTTDRNVRAGAREMNPFMGSKPDSTTIYSFIGGKTLLFYLLGEITGKREGFYTLGIGSSLPFAAWNEINYQNRP